MNFFKRTVLVVSAAAAISISASAEDGLRRTDYVRPLVGTDGYGNVYPGAQIPFGGIQISPDTDRDFYDAAAGYKYGHGTLLGFSLTHLSGTGIPDLGDFLFMPGTGEIHTEPGTHENPDGGYRSRYSHDREQCSPDYYSVELTDYGVKAEMTSGMRSGMFRFTYPESDKSFILIDMDHTLWWECVWSDFRIEDEHTVAGYKLVKGWGPERHVYFTAEFSKPIRDFGIMQDGKRVCYNTSRFRSDREAWGKNLKFWMRFATEANEEVTVKVAISSVDHEGARRNIKEIDGKDFDTIRREGERRWEKELSRFSVEGSDRDKETFYTSVYRCFLSPFVFQDADGRFREHDKSIGKAEEFTNYTTFSLWDTYRAFHPLLNLVRPDVSADIAGSMLAHYDKSIEKMLPIWSFYGNETWCMIGYHAVSVLADMIVKQIPGIDYERAFEAMKTTATNPAYDCIKEYTELGWVPFDKEAESVSKTLEYAYDDYCIAQAAKALGKEEDYRFFLNRSLSYRNLIDPETGYMRGRDSKGEWRTPFSPVAYQGPGSVNGWGDITEGFTLQYTWYVPHNVQDHIDRVGRKLYEARLDSLFAVELPDDIPGAHDIWGRIGGYWHGNEPCHGVTYLYNYLGQPWKCQKWVRYVADNFYGNEPGSLSGNDDCGQMSAWFIFNALGFYPTAPSSNIYNLGSPTVPGASLRLYNGKSIKVTTENWSKENVYVKKVFLNGKVLDKSWLTYEDIRNGAELHFVMSPKPERKRAVSGNAIPPSLPVGIEHSGIFIPDAWKDFRYPEVKFSSLNPGTKGAALYSNLVPDPEAFIREHCRKVAQILFYSASDSMNHVGRINYILKDYDGISAKAGNPEKTTIFFSTRHVENSAKQSMFKLDYETKGVLFHELVHAYQFEPKGIGTYSTNKEFWACIEGLADAVRAEAGYFDISTRKPGGHWLDGYRTTGFFLQWLTGKDPDAIRKFHQSVRDLEVWSFDGAMKYIFGKNAGIESLWAEYQDFLRDALCLDKRMAALTFAFRAALLPFPGAEAWPDCLPDPSFLSTRSSFPVSTSS